MKKSIIISLFLLMTALPGYSTNGLAGGQTKADTTVPVDANAVRNALAAKDSLDLMKQERAVLLALKDQYEKLAEKDSAILNMYDKNVALYDKLISNLEGQLKNQEKQTSNNEKISVEKDKIIKRKNRQLGILGGIILTLGYLFLKK